SPPLAGACLSENERRGICGCHSFHRYEYRFESGATADDLFKPVVSIALFERNTRAEIFHMSPVPPSPPVVSCSAVHFVLRTDSGIDSMQRATPIGRKAIPLHRRRSNVFSSEQSSIDRPG